MHNPRSDEQLVNMKKCFCITQIGRRALYTWPATHILLLSAAKENNAILKLSKLKLGGKAVHIYIIVHICLVVCTRGRPTGEDQ